MIDQKTIELLNVLAEAQLEVITYLVSTIPDKKQQIPGGATGDPIDSLEAALEKNATVRARLYDITHE